MVKNLLADGKKMLSCGVLSPNGRPGIYDEDMFPYTLPRVFQIEYQDSGGITHTDKLETSWIKIKNSERMDIIY